LARGVDRDGKIYWDGRPIEVSRGVVFTFWQKALAVAVSASAIVAALAGVVQAYAALHCAH